MYSWRNDSALEWSIPGILVCAEMDTQTPNYNGTRQIGTFFHFKNVVRVEWKWAEFHSFSCPCGLFSIKKDFYIF